MRAGLSPTTVKECGTLAGIATVLSGPTSRRSSPSRKSSVPSITISTSSTFSWKCSGAPRPGSMMLVLQTGRMPCALPASVKLR